MKMPYLIILADDFTGALDNGVQFAGCGVSTRVVVGQDADLSTDDAAVLVVDTETRHLKADEAAAIIRDLTKRAIDAGVSCIYKKTDSALRGNVGVELAALLEASGCRQLPFLPAFPQIGRITKDGVHYIDGVPVTESPFGVDPFEPVRFSKVVDIIASQTDTPVHSYPVLTAGESVPAEDGILVFDAESAEDLQSTAHALMTITEQPRILAGCAGFASVLPEILGLEGEPKEMPQLDPRLLVLCGSVNKITINQLDVAEQAGFSRLRLTPEQKLEAGYWAGKEGITALAQIERMLSKNDHCIIETNDRIRPNVPKNKDTADYADYLGLSLEELRVRISSSMGEMLDELFDTPSIGTLLMTGGDTLLQCMQHIGIPELEPVCELEKGIVLARFPYKGHIRYVITKSGGFGQPDLLVRLAERIAR